MSNKINDDAIQLDTGSNPKNEEQIVHRLIVEDWQLVSDLSFADLILWRASDSRDFVAAAQCRPATSSTVFSEDLVGTEIPENMKSFAALACHEKKVVTVDSQFSFGRIPTRVEFFPMVAQGKVVGLVSRHMSLQTLSDPSRDEKRHVEFAEALLYMGSLGLYPDRERLVWNKRGMPRAVDGLMQIDADGFITFASPNAVSAFRRLGYNEPLEHQVFRDVTQSVMPSRQNIDEDFSLAVAGKKNTITELDTPKACITIRSLPLYDEYSRYGALVLCKDNTELRRRDKQLVGKDAAIREIQHRVKNNLQTVVALLRMQARRMPNDEAKLAIEQAMRRVNSIALVHETLSQTTTDNVDFDKVIDGSFLLTAELASPGQKITTERTGSFGKIPAEYATPLGLVINELVANAVEHGFQGGSGTVKLDVERQKTSATEDTLRVRIIDYGQGLEKTPDGLGTQIVTMLVEYELRGSITWKSASDIDSVNASGVCAEVVFSIPQ